MDINQKNGIIFQQEINQDALSAAVANFFQQKFLSDLVNSVPSSAQVFLVGGCLRDFLVGESSKDVDLCCSLSPAELINSLAKNKIRFIETGLQHGTITALLPDNQHVEISAFRKPGVREHFELGSSIEEDLAGRDFTINALAFDLRKNKLIDPYGGLADLNNNLVRAVGSAEIRIAEDPLRTMRLVRFGSAAGRTYDTATFEAAKNQSASLKNISVERIRTELEKIILSDFPRAALQDLRELRALEVIIPEFVASYDLEQNEFHDEDVFNHTISVVSHTRAEKLLRFAAFFHDIGKPATLSVGEDGRRHFYLHERVGAELSETIMRRLKFPEKEISAIKQLVHMHMRPITCGPTGLRRLLRELGPLFDTWLELKKADHPPVYPKDLLQEQFDNFMKMLTDEQNRLTGSVFEPLAVDGNDLQAIGYVPGKKLGNTLRLLQEKVIDQPELNNKEVLLELAQKLRYEKS